MEISINIFGSPPNQNYRLIHLYQLHLFSSQCHENYEIYIFSHVCHNDDIINSIDF
jgi:hypothetical protein